MVWFGLAVEFCQVQIIGLSFVLVKFLSVWFGLVWIFNFDSVWGLPGPPGASWSHTAPHSFHNPAYQGPWTDKKKKRKKNINEVGYRVAAQLKIMFTQY